MKINKKGFTLIELMMVMAIVVTIVLAVFQSPQYKDYMSRLASANAAKIFGMDLRLCQQRCIEREEVWGIIITDTANGEYWVFHVDTTLANRVKRVKLSDLYNAQVRFTNLVTDDVIEFDPKSTAPESSSGYWSVVTPKLNDVLIGAGGQNIDLSAGTYITRVTIQQNGVVSY